MSHEPTSLDARLHAYLLDRGIRRDPLLERLAEATHALGGVDRMRVAPEQAAFLELFVRVAGAQRAIEVGTFTGTSAIAIARGLGEGGRLLCCDVSPEWTAIARRYFAEAGVADRIDLRIAPALETIRALPADVVFDLAFVDADKENYPSYYEELLPRIRTGGVLLFDNVFWGGRVADPAEDSVETRAIRALNDRIHGDPRVEIVMLPIADGLTLARKR